MREIERDERERKGLGKQRDREREQLIINKIEIDMPLWFKFVLVLKSILMISNIQSLMVYKMRLSWQFYLFLA